MADDAQASMQAMQAAFIKQNQVLNETVHQLQEVKQAQERVAKKAKREEASASKKGSHRGLNEQLDLLDELNDKADELAKALKRRVPTGTTVDRYEAVSLWISTSYPIQVGVFVLIAIMIRSYSRG